MPVTTSDFTACGWFYFAGDTNSYSTLFCINDSTGTPNDGWYLQTQADGTTLAIWDADGGIWYSTDIGAMTVGNWYHVAIRKNGTNLRGSMRVLTTLTYTTVACAGAPADTFTAANFEFGSDAYPDPVNGNLVNWKIYQADLTDAELLQESLRFVPFRWANLWAWYPMLNTGGQDYGPNGYHLNVSTGLTVGDNPPIVWGGRVIFVGQSAGGGGISGSLSVTQADNTLSSTGVLSLNAALNATQAGDTLSAAGSVGINGAFNAAQTDNTLSATGSGANNGALSATQADNAITSAGVLSINAVLSVVQSDHTVTSAGVLSLNAVLSATQAGDTLSATGSSVNGGALSVTQSDNTMTSVGVLSLNAVLSTTQAGNTLESAGTVRIDGALNVTQAADVLSASGLNANSGVLSATQADYVITSTGVLSIRAVLGVMQDDNTLGSAGTLKIGGSLSITQADHVLSAVNFEQVNDIGRVVKTWMRHRRIWIESRK
jgi:hypothetical protein